MLSGAPAARAILTGDETLKVAHLVAIDAGMTEIGGKTVGAWLVAGNPSPVLGGSSPVAFLTRQGLPGFAALLRRVERWRLL